jgi:hypothetical protein
MDLVTNDLVVITMPRSDEGGDWFLKPNGQPIEDGPSPKFVTGRAEWELMPWARFSLTAKGRTLTSALREYRQTCEEAAFFGFSDYLEAKGMPS